MEKQEIITAIALDQNFLITGDSSGLLVVRKLHDGKVSNRMIEITYTCVILKMTDSIKHCG